MSITRKFLDWKDPPLVQAVQYLLARYAPTVSEQRIAAAGQALLVELRSMDERPGASPSATAPVTSADSLTVPSAPHQHLPAPHFAFPDSQGGPQGAGGAVWDLDAVVLVVPGGRAGRLLLEHLVAMAERLDLTLHPPQIATMGALPERLYEAKRPAASELVQQLAWVRALKKLDRGRLQRVVPQLPPDSDVLRWLTLARLLSRTHRELAADGMDFAFLSRLDWKAGERQERDRWRVLQSLQQDYLRTLDRLDLWDLQTARLVALEHGECRTDHDIVLVGTTDMNSTMRRMLDQVASRVTALIFAPLQRADAFDQHGCVFPDAWQDVRCELEAEQIRVVEGPVEQAEATVAALASRSGRYRADQITIGVPDERLVPHLQRHLERAGVRCRWAVGRGLPETAPYRLLQAVAQYLERGRFADFAQLVRHPDVSVQLDRRLQASSEPSAGGLSQSWLAAIDRYYCDHLPPELPRGGPEGPATRPSESPVGVAGGETQRKEGAADGRVEEGEGPASPTSPWLGPSDKHALVRRVHEVIEQWLAPLRNLEGTGPSPQRKLDLWCEAIVKVLLAIYEGVELDRDHRADHFTLTAAQQIREQLMEQRAVPSLLAPRITASDAIRLLLEQTAGAALPDLPDEEAVSMLGWLELPLDNAPLLVLTSFNEGFVPSSVNADLFLPNNLRQRLGLLDNQRRYARDAYAFQAVSASRRELQVIVGRRDGEGNPLSPSRLLFATDRQTVAERARWFFDPESETDSPASIAESWPEQAAETEGTETAGNSSSRSQLIVPRPVPLAQPLSRLSVTAFRNYLACPYRFYLRHVLKLQRVTDEAEELDAATFGSLIHEVLNGFGSTDIRDSQDEQEIGAFLLEELARQVASRLGSLHLAPVHVQLMQLRNRLLAFARWQAVWRREGWRIRYSEQTAGQEPVVLNIEPGRGLQLTGRIDRIDQNERTGEWFILDYKTSDSARTPEQVHRLAGQWVDLQLPLYRHLVRKLEVGEAPGLGYVLLPKDTSKVGVSRAEWTEADLSEADDLAYEVVGAVLEQQFWPPVLSPRGFFEEFSAICQDSVFDREPWGEAHPAAAQVKESQ